MTKYNVDNYDKQYFDTSCGRPYDRNEYWLNFFGEIAGKIKGSINPKTVLDVGCAKGFLVEKMREIGIEAYGVDISEYAINQVHDSIKQYCKVESILKLPDSHYDLIVCIEVLEHLFPEDAKLAISNLCKNTEDIIFSSSPVDITEKTHHNVQHPAYWANLFSENGFYRDETFDASFITPWAVRFRKKTVSEANLIKSYEETVWRQSREIAEIKKENEEFRKDIAYYRKEHENIIEEKQKIIESVQKEAREYHQSEIARIQSEHQSEHQSEIGRIQSEHQSEIGRIQSEHQSEIGRIQSEHQSEILVKDGQVMAARAESIRYFSELNELKSSPGMRILPYFRTWLNRYFPFGTRRRKWLDSSVNKAISKIIPSAIKTVPKPDEKAPKEKEPEFKNTEEWYDIWVKSEEPQLQDLEEQKKKSQMFATRPLVSIITPTYETPELVLRDTIESVLNQTYDKWELCLVDGNSKNKGTRKIIEEYVEKDSRIKARYLQENLGISGNSNEALKMANGEYIALLDHDDMLSPDALFEVVKCINNNQDVDFIYSDKDMVSNDGTKRFNPLVKPDWSPEIMLSANYLTHLNIIRKSLVDKVGGFRSSTDGAQDWDLFLRIAESTNNIYHIPKILYHWREVSTSVSSGITAKPYALVSQRKTIEDHLRNIGVQSTVTMDEFLYPHIQWKIEKKKFSIILPMLSPDYKITLQSIIKNTQYENYEVILVQNSQSHVDVDLGNQVKTRIIKVDCNPDHFTMARNATRDAKSDYIIFVREGLQVESSNWLDEINGLLSIKGIGIASGKILNPDGFIAHAGIVINKSGDSIYIFSGAPDRFYGVFGSAEWYRNCSAVTDSFVSFKRDLFEFDDLVNFENIEEMCLSAYKKDQRVVYSPYIITRSTKPHETKRKISNFSSAIYDNIRKKGDPFFNPNLLEDNLIPILRVKPEIIGSNNLGVPTSMVTKQKEVTPPKLETPKSTDLNKILLEKQYSEALYLSTRFDFSPEELIQSKAVQESHAGKIQINSIAWFLPDFDNAFFGGINTILRFASFLKEKGVTNYFVTIDSTNKEKIEGLIFSAFSTLAGEKVFVMYSENDLKNIPSTDASVATLWTTAYYCLKFNKTKRKFYFIQDFEPYFYAAGSTMALVEETYRFGFVGIANTRTLKDIYQKEYHGIAESFDPAVDSKVFYPPASENKWKEEITIFTYGRPGHPRNGFELSTNVLKKIKEKYGKKVRIISAGANWNPSEFGLEGIIDNLGVLRYEDTGELFRKCDIGLIMMYTKHPSYIPLELMACRCLVVSNYNPATTWLLHDDENCLLSQPSTSSFVEKISQAIQSRDLRTKITENALKYVNRYSDWNSEFERIYSFMQSPLRKE